MGKCKVIVFATIILAGVILTGCIGSPKVFKSLAGCPDAEIVRIPSVVVRMATARYGVSSVEVASLGNSAPQKLIAKTVERIVRDKKMEVLVESHENDEDNTIYAVVSDDDSPRIKKLLVVAREPGEVSLVYIEGDIKLSDIIKEGKGDVGGIIGMFQ